MTIDRTRLAGGALLLGALQYLLGLFVAEALYPGYDVGANPISDLGATCREGASCIVQQPSSAIFTLIMVVLGTLVFLAGWLFYTSTNQRTAGLLVAIGGAGIMGAGIFNEQWGVHGLFALVAFTLIPLAGIVGYRLVSPSLRIIAVALSGLALGGLVWQLAGTYGPSSWFGPLGDGGVERIIALPMLFWMLVAGASVVSGREVVPWVVPGRRPAHVGGELTETDSGLPRGATQESVQVTDRHTT